MMTSLFDVGVLQFVLTVLALTVNGALAGDPDPQPASFVTRPTVAECRGITQLGELCNGGTGVCTMYEGEKNGKRYGHLECIAPDCGDPGSPPANGDVDVSAGTTFPNVITYTCDCDYALSGDAERTCQSDGTWSGTEPTCTYVPTTPSPYPCSSSLAFNVGYVITQSPPYSNGIDVRACWLAPPCTSITINITDFEMECDKGTADCPVPTDLTSCQNDWFEIIDNGTPVRRLCGTADNIVVSGLSNNVEVWIWSDADVVFYGFVFEVYYE